MKPAGYSGTPLARKLGIREGSRVVARGAPPEYAAWLDPLPVGAVVVRRAARGDRFFHAFVRTMRELEAACAGLATRFPDDGTLWISWPKRSSGVATALSEDAVRRAGLGAGLVDIKVCAVSEVWSGLRFARRLRDRKPRSGSGGR